MNTKHGKAWVALASTNRCRLLQVSVVPTDRCHVEEVDGLAYTWEGHDHGRPSPLSGKSGHTHASGGHEQDEELHRFAHQAATWLGQETQRRDIDRLVVFADPRFLGALRQSCPARLAQKFEERQADLAGFDTSAVSKHPAILELVGLGGD